MPTNEVVLRTALAVAYNAEVNAGAAASIIAETAADAAVITWTLQDPALTESAGVLTMAGGPITSNGATAGTVDHCSLMRDAVKLSEFTAGTSGMEINFTSLTFATSETADLTLTITHP